GGALLLAAPGTFGKTTLAGAFLRAGHRLLADDVTCCQASARPTVLPGPALLRVRHDVFERLTFPDTRRATETAGKVHLALEGPQRGSGSAIPLRGIVLLRRSQGEPAVERADPSEALRDLFALSFNRLVDRASCFERVGDLVRQVPAWYLDRRLDYADLPRTVERIVAACLAR
ncbi:MAG: hypothetical protein ACRDM7_22415, partial [Thermoleophilaceae bacterium]